jgi:tRNA (mo5U34)-methyltransferase
MGMHDIDWWHSIDLGNGVVTPGRVFPAGETHKLCLPDLTGKTVLDIGTWDGFYAFEAERRGAARVLATDSFMWHRGTGRAGFDYAHSALGSRVESLEIDVMDLSPYVVGTFDVVLFLGVIYHLRHPLMALERVVSVVKDLLVLETYTASNTQVGREYFQETRPALVYTESESPRCYDHKFFGPNSALIHHWLKMVEFNAVTVHQDHRLVVHAHKFQEAA